MQAILAAQSLTCKRGVIGARRGLVKTIEAQLVDSVSRAFDRQVTFVPKLKL